MPRLSACRIILRDLFTALVLAALLVAPVAAKRLAAGHGQNSAFMTSSLMTCADLRAGQAGSEAPGAPRHECGDCCLTLPFTFASRVASFAPIAVDGASSALHSDGISGATARQSFEARAPPVS